MLLSASMLQMAQAVMTEAPLSLAGSFMAHDVHQAVV